MSGEPGKRKGTPSPKAFGRDQTRPIERSPRSYHVSRSERSAASGSAPSRCMIAFTRPGTISSTRRTIATLEASRVAASSSRPAAPARGDGRRAQARRARAPGSSNGSPGGRRARRSRRRSRRCRRRRRRRARVGGGAHVPPCQRRSARSLWPSRITAHRRPAANVGRVVDLDHDDHHDHDHDHERATGTGRRAQPPPGERSTTRRCPAFRWLASAQREQPGRGAGGADRRRDLSQCASHANRPSTPQPPGAGFRPGVTGTLALSRATAMRGPRTPSRRTPTGA